MSRRTRAVTRSKKPSNKWTSIDKTRHDQRRAGKSVSDQGPKRPKSTPSISQTCSLRIMTDRGLDFRSSVFLVITKSVAVVGSDALTRSPTFKPIVERYFHGLSAIYDFRPDALDRDRRRNEEEQQ